jgi:hypothetical protein
LKIVKTQAKTFKIINSRLKVVKKQAIPFESVDLRLKTVKNAREPPFYKRNFPF